MGVVHISIIMIVGFDISTTCIGISIFNEDGSLEHIEHILLKTDKNVLPENRYIPKSQMFQTYLQNLKNKYTITKVLVEEPLPSSNNSNTVNTLLKFNGICSWLLHQELNLVPIFLSIREIRKKVTPEFLRTEYKKGVEKEIHFIPKDINKKEYIFNKVRKKYPNLEWFYNRNNKLKKENFDMTDAVAICWAYFIMEDSKYQKEFLI